MDGGFVNNTQGDRSRSWVGSIWKTLLTNLKQAVKARLVME